MTLRWSVLGEKSKDIHKSFCMNVLASIHSSTNCTHVQTVYMYISVLTCTYNIFNTCKNTVFGWHSRESSWFEPKGGVMIQNIGLSKSNYYMIYAR